MRSKRILLIGLLAGFCTVSVLAGGQGEKSSSGGSDSKPWQGKQVTALFFDSTYATMAKEISTAFESQTGGHVEIVTSPFVSLRQKELLALQSGASTYDIMGINAPWMGSFAQYLTDLGPMIQKDNWDTSDIMDSVWSFSGKWNGTVYGVPEAETPYELSYRTDLVPGGVPKTYSDLFAIAKKLNKPADNFYAFATPGVKEQFSPLFKIALWSLGGAMADKNWNVTADSAEVRQALEICKQYIQNSDPAALAWGLPEADAAFEQGHAAFDLAWPTLGVAIDGDTPSKSSIVGKWAVAPFPAEKTGLTLTSSWTIAIPKASGNKEMAWDWIKMFTAKPAAITAFQKYSIPAALVSFWNDPILKQSKLAPLGDAKGVVATWTIPAGNEEEAAMRDAVSNYASGQWDLQTAVSYLQSELTKALKENPPPPGTLNIGR